jgi:6-phosphofructokinase 1
MNAAIRAVVRYGISQKLEVYGIFKGYQGLLEETIEKLSLSSVGNIIQRGGTVLKTSRCPEFHQKSTRLKAFEILKKHQIDGLVVIGGDGSFTGASLLQKETGFPCIGIPGTIDNDIYGTEDTIGFDTSVNTAMEAIDKIRDTASSHDRLFIVEVMGRNSGFIALSTGISGGAENIVIPEAKANAHKIHQTLLKSIARGKRSSIIVVAEGAQGSSSSEAQRLALSLKKLGHNPKTCTLGHIQRGGAPTSHDRMLGSVLGSAAVAYLMSGKSSGMVGIQNNEVRFTLFNKVIGFKKKVPSHSIELAQTLAT